MNSLKKKILIISPFAPFPLRSGADLAQHFFLDELPPYVDIVFCTKINDNLYYKKLKNYKKKNQKIEIVFFDNRPGKFSFLNLKIFVARLLNTVWKKKKEITNKNYKPYSDIVDRSYLNFIEEILKEKKIDIVQFEFLTDVNLAKFLPINIKKVLIHHEIWFKAVELRNNRINSYSKEELEQLKNDEIELLRSFNTIIVFNKDDKILLEKELISTSIMLSPYGIPDEEICKYTPSECFENFLFIGGGDHLPNKQGLQWFLDVIFVPNKEIITQNIVIIGKWSDGFKSQYIAHSKIIFKNSVERLNPFYENSAMIVPILSGSGLRTKTLIALANNVPVLTTKFAAEGLYDDQNSKHLLFFEDAKDFLNIITNNSTNKILQETARLGFDFYIENFSKEDIIYNRLKIYTST